MMDEYRFGFNHLGQDSYLEEFRDGDGDILDFGQFLLCLHWVADTRQIPYRGRMVLGHVSVRSFGSSPGKWAYFWKWAVNQFERYKAESHYGIARDIKCSMRVTGASGRSLNLRCHLISCGEHEARFDVLEYFPHDAKDKPDE